MPASHQQLDPSTFVAERQMVSRGTVLRICSEMSALDNKLARRERQVQELRQAYFETVSEQSRDTFLSEIRKAEAEIAAFRQEMLAYDYSAKALIEHEIETFGTSGLIADSNQQLCTETVKKRPSSECDEKSSSVATRKRRLRGHRSRIEHM
eukprot:Gregarina_sp_Poly_1__8@NODE_1001_length_5410_cov_144_854950_g702_i0_p4_GENE_NODE_1001_length_5410_cov_144_854950_g702_i0NODE_1001_length_5410_cov_144_854950_g702_i0_p4_ORF_typecomplete_len152_score22_23ING/PF12998_7/0_048AIP3/PF03915_13/0_04TPD52/PF04201_15/19TPD52/PF04201_15/1_9Uso1_p115_C/PF04871_13/0_23HAUS5/PF14817_6/15_NODE_1001_length_5410_cov_144_854950_g702_i049495404